MNRLALLRASVHGQSLYAAAPVSVTHTLAQFNRAFGDRVVAGQRLSDAVVVRGRVVAKRDASKKLVFYTVEAQQEKLQIMCSAKDAAASAFEEMHALTARGDVVSVRGCPGRRRAASCRSWPPRCRSRVLVW
jgi:lysyl-tRNA synthetase class II